MRIIIDSNIIIPDYRLTGARLRVLLSGYGLDGHELYIPQVVIDEVTGKAAREVEKKRRETSQKIDSLDQSPLPVRKLFHIPSHDDVYEAAENFKAWLVATLTDAGAIILPYPSVSHEVLVGRIMHEMRPFLWEKDDEGYRDALVWETVLELAQRPGTEIALITNDKAFSEDGQLHPDLVSDLGMPMFRSGVTLFPTLDGFNQMYLTRAVEYEDIRCRALAGEISGFSVNDIVEQRLERLVSGKPLSLVPMGGGMLADWARADQIAGVDEVKITDVRRTVADMFLFTITALVQLVITASFLPRTSWNLDADNLGPRDDVQVRQTRPATITIEVVFDEKIGSVTSDDLIAIHLEPVVE